jgi:hypothetical protein
MRTISSVETTPRGRSPRSAWLLLGLWLLYSLGAMAWYLMNDPAWMASLCRT